MYIDSFFYASSVEYVVKITKDFGYSKRYNSFCGGLNREQTLYKLKKDLEEGIFHIDPSKPQMAEWIKEQCRIYLINTYYSYEITQVLYKK
jgi:hypothetical protein